MIPTFPNFKKLELTDKEEVEKITSKFPPYSDFNFVSMWSWNIKGEMQISQLNNNLIVRFTDYLTGEPFYSFLGDNKVNETAEKLLELSKKEGFSDQLKLVPEDSIKGLDKKKFHILESRDHFDYIFSVSELADLRGVKFKEKRHSATKFLREYPDASFEIRELNDQTVCEHIVSVFHRWGDKKKSDKKTSDAKHEEMAISRLLQTKNNHKLIISCVFLHDVMIGFGIDEILPLHYAISHFLKTDNTHKGVSDFLNRKLSQYLLAHDIKFWNWEQDLGIEHLRRSKMSHHPVNFFKKYKVSINI